ncbi:hypothetical protein [Bacillus alkalicellulosilyticus]|uniref:hypothetical protein n=1 Tax=Alkalihalobacterium alkalicellulosilyticum TaxID=1912214 RepID=UPI00099655BF|nr:hypothetical protein [Bacillus alkalicellulosilyticus]
MIKKTIKIDIPIWNDYTEDLQGYHIVDASLGPRGEVCILAVNDIPGRIDGMFPPVKTTEQYDYKVIIDMNFHKQIVEIKNQRWNYHFVQPIEDNHILLVCGRSYYYEEGKYDLNAKVFDSSGAHIRQFLLGDAIQDIYVTKENTIWTSYFDEGIFGNYGWEDPVGKSGLRAWDQEGNAIYHYPNSGLNFISDCYALNVVADEDVWFYYYTDFLVGRYHHGEFTYYKPDIEGSDGFVLFKNYFLFRGGYENQDKYLLYKLFSKNSLRRSCFISFSNEEKKNIKADYVSCRGSKLLLTEGKTVYIVDLKDIVDHLLTRKRG